MEKDYDTEENLVVYGRNGVLEALKSNRSIDRIVVLDQKQQPTPISAIIAEARQRQIVVQFRTKEKLNQMVGHDKHQGVVALVAAYDYVDVSDILETARLKGEAPFIIILDEIEDPHNLGAILRTANVTGVHGVIIPKRRAVGLTATVAKTSAGAIEYTKVARVTNLVRTIDALKAENIFIGCADMDGTPMYKSNLTGALALVIGSEGKGVTRLVKEHCDFILSIPMQGDITSLNASVATGVVLYEALRQRMGY